MKFKILEELTEMGQQLRALAALAEDPTFSSQHPHGGSQQSVTPVPEDQIPLSSLCGYQACM